MPRKDDDVPGHDQSDSRQYLANEVRAQRHDITELSEKVSDIDKRVTGSNVSLATLIEAERRARESRGAIWDAINAMRAEQQQIALSNSGIPGALDRLSSAVAAQGQKLNDIDNDRQQMKGAASVAKAISGAGWGMVGLISGGILAAIGFATKYFASSPPPTFPPGHP